MDSLGFRLGKWIYHRFVPEKPPKKPPREEIKVPRTDDGAPIPIVFGRCRVRAPNLVWASDPYVVDVDDSSGKYRVHALDMLFCAGIVMGDGVTRGNSLAGPKLHNVWWGDYKLPSPGELPHFSSSLFYGQSVARLNHYGGPGRGGGLRGSYHWFGGWTDQSFTAPPSQVGDRLTAWGATGFGNGIPGLANMMCVSFTTMPVDSSNAYFNITAPDVGGTFGAVPLPANGFIFGESSTIDAVSVEISTYGDRLDDVTGKHIFSMQSEGVDFGGDADPAEALYVILTSSIGGLGIDPSKIDTTSFAAASATLKAESHGFSRAMEEDFDADAFVQDLCAQVDGVVDEDPSTGKIVFKLIRPDFDPSAVMHITRDNCKALTNGASGGRTNLVNKVKITFRDRALDYGDNAGDHKNPANAVGELGGVNEAVIDMPGVKQLYLANQIAAREVEARSRPLIKCSALVGREFATLLRGDVVKLTWTNPDISGIYFRIADVDRGTVKDGLVRLDLIQDFHYTWRNRFPVHPHIPPDIGEKLF